MFKVIEIANNSAHEIFHGDSLREIQDYLWRRWSLYRAENCSENEDDEAEQILFYSRFSVENANTRA